LGVTLYWCSPEGAVHSCPFLACIFVDDELPGQTFQAVLVYGHRSPVFRAQALLLSRKGILDWKLSGQIVQQRVHAIILCSWLDLRTESTRYQWSHP